MFIRFVSLFSLVLVVFACSDGKKGEKSGSSEEPFGPCVEGITVSSPLPSETAEKELQVTFSVAVCQEPYTAWVANGDRYFPATKLSHGSYRRYVPLEPGINTIRISIKDGSGEENVASAHQISYAEGPIQGDGSFGTVHGSVAAEGNETPIQDAVIYVRDVPGVVRSDASGAFQVPVPAGRSLITIEKEGYTLAQRWVTVESGNIASLAMAYLLQGDTKVMTFQPETENTLDNSAGDIQIHATAGAVRAPVDVSAISFPKARTLPGRLPDSSGWTQAFEASPEGVRFDEPVTIRQENINGFPPGFEVPVGYYNRDKGAWEPQGMSVVTADGLWLEFKTDHFSPYDINAAVNPRGKASGGSGGSGGKDDCDKGDKGNSIVDDIGGQLSLFHPVSSYLEDNEVETVFLAYNSGRAAGEVDIVSPIDANTDGTVERLTADVDFAGHHRELSMDTGANTDGDFLIGTRFTNRAPDGSLIEDGLIPIALNITKYERSTYMSTTVFGGGGLDSSGTPTREALPFTTRKGLTAVVDSGETSSVGKGWDLSVREWLTFHNEPGFGLWHRGGKRPKMFVTGLPGKEPVDLSAELSGDIRDMALDASGGIYIIDDYGQLYFAPSVENAAALSSIDHDTGLDALIPWGNSLMVLDDNGVLYDITATQALVLVQDVFTELMTQQFMQVDDANVRIDVPDAEAGAVMDKYGQLWMLGTGAVLGSDQSMYTMPLVIQVDLNASPMAFRSHVITRLSEYEYPATLTYNADEHALYYLFFGENTLRRFDIAGLNEDLIRNEEAFSSEYQLKLVMGAGSKSYVVTDEKLIRLSKDGVMTVMGETLFEQDRDFGGVVKGVAIDSTGEPVFVSEVADTGGMVVSRKDLTKGLFPDSLSRIDTDGADYLLTGLGGTRRFDEGGRLVSVLNQEQETTATLIYDGDKLVAYKSKGGGTTTFEYIGERITGITDPAGRTRVLSIDASDHLTSITNQDGAQMTFSYDELGRITSKAGGAGQVNYAYDDIGSVTTISLDTGETRSFVSLLQGVQPMGIGDGDARTSKVVDGEGYSHGVRYDMNGEPVGFELDGDRWDIEQLFDPATGNLTAIVSKDGEEIARNTVDEEGRLLDRSRYGVSVVNTSYDTEWGEESHEYFGDSCRVFYEEEYTEYSCPNGSVYFYMDSDGHLAEVEDEDGERYLVETDSAGNPVSITDPLGYTVQLERDGAGNVIRYTDFAERTWNMTYTHGNEIASVSDATGGTFSAEMNRSATCDGCVVSGKTLMETMTDPFNGIWSAALRADGMYGGFTSPLGHETRYGYNGNRLLDQVVTADGLEASVDYSKSRRVTVMRVDDEEITYSYNERDELALADSPSYAIEWQWDYGTNTVREVAQDKVSGVSYTQTRTYDPATGRDTGFETGYGERWEIEQYGNTVTVSDGAAEVYVSAGRNTYRGIDVTNQQGSGVIYQSITTDAAGRVDYESWSTYADSGYLTYAYDGGGREPQVIESDNQEIETLSFAYDATGRLASQGGSSTQTFTYDAAGRIATSSQGGTFTYDGDWRLQSTDNASYTYADSGMRASRTDALTGEVWAYEYDALDRLTSVNKTRSGESAPYATTRLRYDPLGRLVSVDVNGAVTLYEWKDYILVAERDGSGAVIRSYIPSIGLDGVAVVKQDGASYYALIDPKGSVLRLVDDTGAVVARYAYNPYGLVLEASGSMAAQPRRFTGALYLESIGLYYLRTRFLDPEVGQFITRDPVWKMPLTPYMYCDGRPHNCTDPLGLEGEAGAVSDLAGSQIKSGIQQAAGPAGVIWQFSEAVGGYKPGDNDHNGRHGMKKIASVTFLDKSPAFRKIMKKVESFWDWGKGLGKGKKPDPCD